MFEFNYVKAKSLTEAQAFVAAHPEAKLLSGGMTLIPTLKQRLAQPSHLVDIGGLPELRGIEVKGTQLVIGAATPHYEVRSSPIVKKAMPALAALANQIGDPQVRNRGTLGGSVANNDPAADYPAAVLALDATVVTNKREIAAGDFFQGMFATALEDGEIVVRVRFNIPKRAAYKKFPHPASGYAMAGVFVAERCGGAARRGHGRRVRRVPVGGSGAGADQKTERGCARRPAARRDQHERRHPCDARIPCKSRPRDGQTRA